MPVYCYGQITNKRLRDGIIGGVGVGSSAGRRGRSRLIGHRSSGWEPKLADTYRPSQTSHQVKLQMNNNPRTRWTTQQGPKPNLAKTSDKERLCETFHQTPSGRDNADEEQVRLELGCPTHTHARWRPAKQIKSQAFTSPKIPRSRC